MGRKKKEIVMPKTFEEFKALNMGELRAIGKDLKIPKYYQLKEDSLITAIMIALKIYNSDLIKSLKQKLSKK